MAGPFEKVRLFIIWTETRGTILLTTCEFSLRRVNTRNIIPHDYQKFATQFVLEHPYCGLILDMGLG